MPVATIEEGRELDVLVAEKVMGYASFCIEADGSRTFAHKGEYPKEIVVIPRDKFNNQLAEFLRKHFKSK